MRISRLLLTLVLVSQAGPGQALPRLIGGGADAGIVSKTSHTTEELDGKGSSFSAYGSVSIPTAESGYLTLALGLQSQVAKGQSDRRTQEVMAQTLLFDVDYRWMIWGFEPGLVMRINRGKSASLKAQDVDTTASVLNLGPELAYRWKRPNADIVAYARAIQDINVSQQVNASVVVGLQYWIKSDPSTIKKEVEPKVEPTPEPVLTPEPVPAPKPQPVTILMPKVGPNNEMGPIILIFKSDTLNFARNDEKLSKYGQEVVEGMGKVLLEKSGQWSRLMAEGHSDSEGGNSRRNLEISELRAQTLRRILVDQGIPADSIGAKGFGPNQPLEGLDAGAPENRRVELKIYAKDPSGIIEALQNAIPGP